MQTPTTNHCQVVKRVLRFLKNALLVGYLHPNHRLIQFMTFPMQVTIVIRMTENLPEVTRST